MLFPPVDEYKAGPLHRLRDCPYFYINRNFGSLADLISG